MAENALLSILHISDFHYSKRHRRDQEIVVEALSKDLEALCIGHRRPDVIVFTGDLVQAAGIDSYDEAYDLLLGPVSSATGCSDERIFIVPGNHDLSQSVVDKTRVEHTEWREKAEDMAAINSMYEADAFHSISEQKFAAYRDLEKYLSGNLLQHQNQFVSVFHVGGANIDVVVLNTSLLSGGGLKELGPDQGKLLVPEFAIIDAVKKLKPNSYRIFATHHPFRMLSETGSRYLQSAIEEHAHLHLFGHMHDPEARNSVSFRGTLFSDQAGAVFTQRKGAYIGYSLISIDRANYNYESHLRTYFDERKSFDEARDILADGRFYSSQHAREFWRKIATPVEDERFRAHLMGPCLASLRAELDEVPGDRDLHEMFVSPPMKRTFIKPGSGDDGRSVVDSPVAFEELVSDDANVILYAAPEYGRTSVLKELHYRLLSEAKALRFPRFPIMVDFGDIKHNAANLLRLVKSRAIAPPEFVDIESLLMLGHVCLLFDDTAFNDARKMQILREFVTGYPKVRYILSSPKNSAAPLGSHVVPEMPIHFDFIELCVLHRRQMRELVMKFGNHSTDVDILLDRLQSQFREINLPFTAANGSILMSIYEEHSGFRPINRSVLIEQFVDTTLRKAAIEQSRRETFDYGNKTALLAHIAGWMVMNNQYIPSIEATRSEIKSYLDTLGLNAPIDQLMAEFFVARIFVKRADDRLSFRYRAVLEYFIALQMREVPEFKAWILEEDRYLQFVNEIQYYAGKLRNDQALVAEIGNRFSAIISAIDSVDLHQLTSLKLPGKKENLDRLSHQLSVPPMTEEERDEELQAELPRDVEERQEVFRPQIENPAQKLLVSLVLYSGLLKNMELINDAEKRRHLAAVWNGWSIFLHFSLSIVPALAHHRRLRINGVLYEISAPHGMSEVELARAISLNMPVSVSKVIAGTLGTEKLERQLVEPQLDASRQPLVFEFFRASLIADLRLSAAADAIRTALKQLRPSSYLLEAMILKIAELRRLDRFSKQAFDQIAPHVAEGIATLKGGSKQEKERVKRDQINRLRREGLLLRIERHNEGN